MTDEEFQRLKEAEKEHLRAKKRLRSRLESLKRRSRGERIVQKMRRGAERLLDETESLVDQLRRTIRREDARVEVALESEDAVRDAEEALREERAEMLLRQYKAAQSTSRRPARSAEADEEGASASEETREGPEKTIGRMRTPRSDGEDT